MIADIYELSPMQAGMLFHRLFAPDSIAYFDQFSCRISGDVDPGLLCRAWQQLVDRHPVLRTSFHWEGLDKPVQVVHADAALPWDALDWRGVPPDEQAARWASYLTDDRARGFQPDVAPLMRAAIVRLTERDYYFCWSHHHLLLDGWCLQLVMSEVFERYDALIHGRVAASAPVRPYGEYIKWLQRQDQDAIAGHWRAALRGFSAATPLFASAGGVVTNAGQADAVVDLQLDQDVSDALRTLATRHRLTLNTLVQGAWALLLSRYSGSDDVVFGVTVSGRPPDVPGIETMLGVFINTLPARVQVPREGTTAAWLAGVQAQQVARDSFAAIPLSDIQKLADLEPGAPLFDTNVIVMNYRMDEALAGGAAGLTISDLRIVDQTDVPLTLQVTPGRQIALEILYDRSRFDSAAMTRMLGHVAHLLTQLLDGLDRPLAALEVVTAAERAQILNEFNATDAPLDPRTTAIHMWEARVAATPNEIALECNEIRLTYRQLNEWANRLARGLQQMAPADRPLGTDALVAIAFARSERLVAAILAVWKCGAAYVPIDPDYPAERIRQVIESASPCVVLRDAGSVDLGLEATFAPRVRFASFDEVDEVARDASRANLERPGTGADLAYVIFTSGSTGQPKGAMVEQTGLLNHILAKIEDLHLDDRSVVVQNASHCFDISVWQCFAALLSGGRTLVYTDALVLNPALFLEQVRTDRVTVLEVVPSYLGPLLDQADDERAGHGARPFGDLQWLLVTGETVKPSLVERWFRVCPSIPVVNAYGPTEASDDITHAFMREAPLTSTVPVGKPLRNFHIYVVDERMRLCPIGVPGELCVSGPGVGRGYLNDPARTAAVFLEDPFRIERGVRMYRTGDVGWFAEDGALLLSGRKDHQVKVRGYRIELGDIEAALTGLDAVRDAVVVDRHGRAAGGTYLAAYVTLRDRAATSQEILSALAARLPGYMVPSTCTVLERLPLTPNGKIDRKALPAPVETSRADQGVFVGPRTPQEHALAEIWGDVLGVERPGIHDNFFAVGGDSILSMQIVSRASRAGFAITPRDVFQHQTIAELAAVARPMAALPAVGGRRVTGPARLAPAQQQFFEDVTVDRHHYNQSILLEVPAGFEPERCARALEAVVAHHEALRLRFTESHGVWRQAVAASESSTIFETHAAGELEAIGGRVQASLDLARGPLVRAAFIDRGPDQPGRLLIVAHHLAVDGVSWRVILADLAEAYDALTRGETVALPPVATPFLDWADSQVDSARPHPAAREPNAELNTVGSASEVAIMFDAATTRRFQTMASGTSHGGPTALLLAATALAYGAWTNGRQMRVDLETHGRDGVDGLDLTRTVGWLTSTVPVTMDLPGDTTVPGGVVAMAAEALRRAADAPTFDGPRPDILLNYHGRIDSQQESRQGWRLSSDPHGPDRSPRQVREYPLEINGLVAGGELRITVGYSRNLHGDDTVAALARHLEAQLTGLVTATSESVADVEDVYDLSPTQQGVLFHGLVAQTSEAYFNQLTCVLRGALDVTAFVEAWRVVTARHAALRTSFHWQGLEHPVQAVHHHAEIPWVVDDWSALPTDLQDRRWGQQSDDDRRRPFDVSVAPLMRCALVRMGGDTHRFRWSQHHLLLDGWSASIVLQDVLTAYDAIARGGRFDAPAPPPFRDHIYWLARQDQAAAGRFWRQELAGFDQPTSLVLGLPEMDGMVGPSRMAEAERRLPNALAARLMTLSAANRVTLHTLFQGIWGLLLGRQGGTADVVFGSIVSGRSAAVAGSEVMVGLFLNTIPARVRLADEAPIFDWLRGLQQAHAAREEYAYSPLADVQRESGVPGGESLFDTILIFENYPVGASLAGTGHALSIADVRAFEPNNYPMTFVVTPGDAIALKIMFDEGRFDRATIDRTLDHIVALLSGIADEPEGRLGQLSVLTPAERAQMDRSNQTAVAMPSGETVLSLIEAHARRTPSRIAVVCDDRRVTYGALNARANQLARVLRASGRLGQADDHESAPRVVVHLRRSAVLPETVLALWKCGATYVPIDPEYPAERVKAIITNARPALVIDEALLEQVAAACVNEDDADLAAPQDPSDLAYVIFTSGSTGVPKGAMVEHAGFLNHVLSMVDDLALAESSVVAQTASHSFDISMWQMFAALVAGGTTVIYPDAMVRRPDALAAQLETDAVSVAQFVPSYLNVFLDALETMDDDERPAFGALTHMVVIGEALTSSTIARWFRLYPHIPLMNTYGPTEASDSVTHVTFTGPVGGALVPIGRPIRNMTVYVVDGGGRLCPAGVKGEIWIGGVGVGRGYLFDEERTRTAFLADPFRGAPHRVYRSGDVGCLHPDGALLFFGRRDHQVKIRGHRIELGEVESCLAAIDDVRDAVVVAGGNASGDRILCAYVTAQGSRVLDPEALTRHLSEHLPRHAVPDVVRVLPDMPVMPNGKVDRRALEAREITGAMGNTPVVAPQSDAERALVRIWSAVLGRDDIGVDDSFFDIGGHSLKAIQIVSRINRDLGAAIDVGDIFACVTVRQLAERVVARSLASSVALVPQPDQEDYDPSPTQARMWLASRTPEGSASYNMAGIFQLEGAVDVVALERAFRALVARHEALRTVFVVRSGSLRLKVLGEAAAGEVFRLTDVRGGVLNSVDADELDRTIQAKIAAPMDLSCGPLFDTELLRVGDGQSVLIVRLHHLVGDAASIRIVLREALALYAAFRRGDTSSPLAPLVIQYRDFVAWRNQCAAAGARETNRRYWLDTLNAGMPRTGFVPDTLESVSATAPGITAIAALDDTQTTALRAVAARHGTTLFGVIVSAVYALLHRYRQQEDLVIGSTVSLRDHPLLEDQVGCYIDTMVLRGTAAGHDTATDLLDRTARVCREALAHRDYPFDALVNDLGVAVPQGKTPLFDVLIDYVPGPDAIGLSADDMGLVVSEYPRAVDAAHHDVMVLVGESDDGSRLSIQLVFAAGRFSEESVALARTRLLAVLQWLTEDDARTLGDVDLLQAPAKPRRRLHIGLNTG